MANIYCRTCKRKTDQRMVVDSYATQCVNCGTLHSSLERIETEANRYTTPDGYEGILVENDKDHAVFLVEEGKHTGLYVYDKKTGFGAIRNLP